MSAYRLGRLARMGGVVAIIFMLGGLRAVAGEPPTFTEPVTFSFKISGVGNGIMTVYDEAGAQAIGHTTNNATTESSGLGLAKLRPGKKYAVNFQGSGPSEFWLSYIAPADYQLWIEEAGTGFNYPGDLTYEYTGGGEYNGYNYTIELRPIFDQSRAELGVFSGIDIGKSITWSVGLGGLRSGRSAGRISFRETDLTNAPADRARLYYSAQPNDSQIFVAKDGPTRLRQIATAQGIVNFDDLDASNQVKGYEIKFYNWHFSPAPYYDTSLGRYAVSGDPWRVIRVEPNSTSSTTDSLKITVTENGDVRISVVQLGSGSGTIASGNYTLLLTEGTGAPWARTTTHASSKTGTVRTDTVDIKGTDNVVVAKSVFTYGQPGDWGEELTSATAYKDDTHTLGTTSYTYYTTSSDRGNYRRMRSVTDPTGNWVAMQYYDDWDRRGQLMYEFHPFQSDPSTVSLVASTGHVFYFDYSTADWTGRHSQPSLRKEFIGNIEVGRSEMTISDVSGSSPARVRTTITSYASASATQTSVVEAYRSDAGADFIGQTYQVESPDDSKVSYALSRGSFDYGTRTFSPNTTGEDWRVMAYHGSKNTSAGNAISTYAGQSFESLYLVPEKSILEVTYLNNSGLVIRTEALVYTGGTNPNPTFSLLTYQDAIYMADSGRLFQTTTNNGVTVQRSYHAGRLNHTIDEGGTDVYYEYDALNRVQWSKKAGVDLVGSYEAQPDLYTHYVYDAANNVKEVVTTTSSTKPTAGSTSNPLDQFATAEYDFAGQQTKSAVNAGTTAKLETSYVYDPATRTVSTTMPGSRHKVVETYLDGQVRSVSGDGVISEFHSYFVDTTSHRKGRQSTYGDNASAWTNTYWDWLDRKVEEWKPGWNPAANVAQIWSYNSKGQLWKYSQPDMAPTLFVYDTLGQRVMAGLDVGGTPADTLQTNSSDRITETAYRFYIDASRGVREVTTKTYATAGNSTPTTVAVARQYLSNLGTNVASLASSTDIFGNTTTSTTTIYRTSRKIVATTNAPDATTAAVQTTYNGLLVESIDTSGIDLLYKYDGIGRRKQSLDPRTGLTTTTFYDNTGQVHFVKQDGPNLTLATYTYDAAGQVASVQDALGNSAFYRYTTRGQKEWEWGQTVNPAKYVYDSEGRLTFLQTYRGGAGWNSGNFSSIVPGTPDLTRWVYDSRTGFLKEKYDAGNLDPATGEPISGAKKISYAYTQGGKVAQRTWARGVTTTYGYDPLTGDLQTTNYSSGSGASNLILEYNRLGQVTKVTDAIGERILDRCVCGKLLGETFSGNYYGAASVTHQIEASLTGAKGRTTGVTVSGGSYTHSYAYTYEPTTGRFKTLTASGAGTYSYDYLANSNLIWTVGDSSSGWQQTRSYLTNRDLLDTISTTVGTAPKAAYDYDYDELGRRKNVVQTGEIFSRYVGGGETIKWEYNDRSEVTSANYYHGTNPADTSNPVGQRSFGFNYDNMGNRATTNGSTQDARGTGYEINERNQIVARTTPAYSSLSGFAPAGTAVTYTVNGGSAQSTTRQGDYFHAAPAAGNASSSVWQNLAFTSGGETASRGVFVSKATLGSGEKWTYDDDGNLTKDDRWIYTWDAENRLASMETRSDLLTGVTPVIAAAFARRLEFTYDYLNRRVAKVVRDGYNSGSGYTHVLSATRFLYDGWNLLVEFDASGGTPTPVRGYGWGLDLSGSMQGAGGVGGLLLIRDFVKGAFYQPAYDGNGNLTALTNRLDGSLAAAYEYGPFGETLRATGPYAASNPFRFSTKYTDDESGLVYYGLRYYSPSAGRFISRDPINEKGGANLYAFVSNSGINKIDLLGMVYEPRNCRYESYWDCSSGYCVVKADWTCDWIWIPDNPAPNPNPPSNPNGNNGSGSGSGGSGTGGTGSGSNNGGGGPGGPPAPPKPNDVDCAKKAGAIENARNALMSLRKTANNSNNHLIAMRAGNQQTEVGDQLSSMVEYGDRGNMSWDAANELIKPLREFMEGGSVAASAIGSPISAVSLIGSTINVGAGVQSLSEGKVGEGIASVGAGFYGFTSTTLNMMNSVGSLAPKLGAFVGRANPITLIASGIILDVQIGYTNVVEGRDLEQMVASTNDVLDRMESAGKIYETLIQDYSQSGCK